ncbi:MAG: hypothetical protein P8I61_06160 [Opitutae bacterium]|nr:hypothetical protein [Opitutae bacterium]
MNLKINRQIIFNRCLKALCPNCGLAKIGHSWIIIHEKCPECNMPIKRGNGFYIGPICLNYGVIAFGIISPLLILGFSNTIPIVWTLSLSILFSFSLPILFYPVTWSLWLMIYYSCLPKELHGNRPENSDDLLFDEDERL